MLKFGRHLKRAQHFLIVPNADFPQVLEIALSGPHTMAVDRAGNTRVNHDVVDIEKTEGPALRREGVCGHDSQNN